MTTTLWSCLLPAILSSTLLAATGAQAATQTILSQSDGARLIAAGEKSANGLNDHVCVAVVDQSGMLLAFTRMDTAPSGCIDSSILKARAAALYRTPTVKYMDRANGKEPAIATLPGVIPLGGGTPVSMAGTVVGAVGVSGAANPDEIKISEVAAAAIK